MDSEASNQRVKADVSFGRLWKRVRDEHDILMNIKCTKLSSWPPPVWLMVSSLCGSWPPLCVAPGLLSVWLLASSLCGSWLPLCVAPGLLLCASWPPLCVAPGLLSVWLLASSLCGSWPPLCVAPDLLLCGSWPPLCVAPGLLSVWLLASSCVAVIHGICTGHERKRLEHLLERPGP